MSKKNNPALIESMRELYVDANGNTIAEAVDLGMFFLRFADGVSRCKEASVQAGMENAYAIDFFFMSLIVESSSLETYKHNELAIKESLENWKQIDEELGLRIQDVVFSTFLPILENKVYLEPAANIALRFSWLESSDRMGNAHSFAETNPMISFANFQCSYHPLSVVAFLCSQDLITYRKMSMRVESFVYDSAKHALEDI